MILIEINSGEMSSKGFFFLGLKLIALTVANYEINYPNWN